MSTRQLKGGAKRSRALNSHALRLTSAQNDRRFGLYAIVCGMLVLKLLTACGPAPQQTNPVPQPSAQSSAPPSNQPSPQTSAEPSAMPSAAAKVLTMYALAHNNRIMRFNSNSPSSAVAKHISGDFEPNESLIGIDYRPADGKLYAVSNQSRLYTINVVTLAATRIRDQAFAPDLDGGQIGMDFDPVGDRLRILAGGGQNQRINPDNGATAGADQDLRYLEDDINAGYSPAINGVAYTNPEAGQSRLYAIDYQRDTLVCLDQPETGKLRTVGPLGGGVNANYAGGFDIAADGRAFAILAAQPTDALEYAALYQANLETGAMTKIENIGAYPEYILGLAISKSRLSTPIGPVSQLQPVQQLQPLQP